MANAYANLGDEIGNILATATVGSPDKSLGSVAGYKAGSEHGLRSAQTGNALADTQKILYELGLAKQGNQMTGGDLATSMGVPPDITAMLEAGQTGMEGARAPGAVGPQPAVPIPQDLQDTFTNANTVKALQKLSGGTSSGATAKTLMDALMGGQDMRTMSNMQAGRQAPTDVAEMQAAIQGKYPSATGAGSKASKVQEVQFLMEGGQSFTDAVKTVYSKDKSPTAKVQEVEHLVTLGIPQEVAIDAVHGNPKAKTYADVYAKVFAQTFSITQATKAAQNAADQYKSGYEPGANAQPPGDVVKIYQ